MASAESRHIISCPHCGARFAVDASLAGRRARCDACNEAFVVPAPSKASATKPKTATRAAEPPASAPQLVGFECRVCGTRLYGRSDQVGKKVKCPDCGAGTAIPEPPKPKPKNMPAALEGEQYELWDADEQPLPSELIAVQPKYIAVMCRQCGSLMYATVNQVGQQIACPDCGTKHIVPPTPKPVAKRSVMASDRETPKLDLAAAPGVRPSAVPHTLGLTLAEQERETEYNRALEKSRRTGKPMEIDARGRPIMPRWPLISGVVPFLFSAGVPTAWLGLSTGLVAAGWLFLSGLEMAMSGGMGAIAGMCFFVAGCIVAMICGAGCSSFMLQIIMESSEGNRQIQTWPSIFDWFGSFAYVVIAGAVSATPGWAISHIPPIATDPRLVGLSIAAGVWICFPIILLSQLDIDSPFGIASGRVLVSLGRCPLSWTFFYLESALLIAICGGAWWTVAAHDSRAAVWLIPLFVAALILFARLLGRLAWRLAGTLAVNDSPTDGQRPIGPKNYNPPRGRKSTT